MQNNFDKLHKKEGEMTRDFIYGVDIGWVSQLEARGIYWINDRQKQIDPIEALQAMGADAVRLRVFVHPPDDAYWHKPKKEFMGREIGGEDTMLGFCGKEQVLEMAARIKKYHMRLMIDFHYSDHFADPTFQDMPAEWENDDFETLVARVEQHTKEVLDLLTKNGIFPDWVQVGNEVNTGIMHPEGSIIEQPAQLITFLNTGYRAVKSCCPDCQVVTHIAGGHDYNICTKFFDVFFSQNGLTDIIGLSYYPHWMKFQHDEKELTRLVTTLVGKYGKPVMLSEIGAPENEAKETYELLFSSIRAMRAVADGKGLGLFYWEPEVGADFLPDHYPLGAAKKAGENRIQFTRALTAYRNSK